MNIKIRYIRYIIFILILLYPMYCCAEQTVTSCYNDGLNALMETANAYYSQGKQLQYDSFKKILSATPEDATSKNYIYTVCSGFTYQTYNQTLGIKLPDTTSGLINYAIERRKTGDKTKNIVFWASKANGDPTSDSREKIYSKVKNGDIVVYQSSKGNGHALLIEKVDTTNKVISILEGGGRTVKDEKEDYDPNGAISSKDFTYNEFQENYEEKYKLAIIRVFNKDFIKVENGKCEYSYTNKSGNKSTIGLTSSAQARLKLPKIYIAKIIKKEENQNYAKIGEKLNYQLIIRNKNTSKDYTNLKVVEKITVLNSDGSVYKETENIITKDKLSLPKKTNDITSEETINFTYTIPNDIEYIGKIILSEGKVNIDDYSIATSKIVTKVGNPINTEKTNILIDEFLKYKNMNTSHRKFISDLYKNALGLNLSFINKTNQELLKNHNPIDEALSHSYGKYYGKRINHNINNNDAEGNNLKNEGLSIYDFDAWDIYSSNTLLDRARTLNVSMLRSGDIILLNKCSKVDGDGSGNTNGNCLYAKNAEQEYIYLENITIDGNKYSKALFNKKDNGTLDIISYDDKYHSSIGFDTDSLNAFLRDIIGENYLILRPHLANLTIKSMPKTTFIQNYENFDISGGKLSVIYNDSSNKKEVDFSKATITGFDNTKVNSNKEITVKYDGGEIKYNIAIVSKQITSIQINTLPIKKEYIQNYENLDLDGGYITVKYNDNSTDKISLTNSNIRVTGFDNSKIGTNTLTVIYNEHSTTFNVDIVSKQVTGIEIQSLPTKKDYIQNYEELDLSGGSIKITYDDSTSSIMSMNNTNIKVLGFDNTKIGENILTVSYLTKTITFNINIISKQITSINISTLPSRISYIQNYENLDLTGGYITVKYDDNTTNNISLSNSKVSVTGFDNSKVGTNTLTVTYFGHTTTYDVIIVEKEVSSITIDTMPSKKDYIQNYEELDLTGGYILVKYNNNTSDKIGMDNSNIKVTGFNNKRVGTNTLTVTYLSKTTTFKVNIISKKIKSVVIDTLPNKKDYIQNYEELDLSGGYLKVTYDDNSISKISMENENISFEGFNNSIIGTNKVYVYYMSYQVEFIINIISKQITGMSIKLKPTKTTYIQNYEQLDLTGGSILVTYTNNSTSEISLTNKNIKVTGFNNSTIGKNKINVEYLGFKAEFYVEIISRQMVGIIINKLPIKLQYSLNDKKIDLSGGEIKITYNDKTTSITSLMDNNIKIIGFDTTKLGTKKITIDYFGNKTSFNIEVVESEKVSNPKTFDFNIITVILTIIITLTLCIFGIIRLKKLKKL